MIKDEDIKTEPVSVELAAEANAVGFEALVGWHCIKIEDTSVQSSTRVAENDSTARSAIGAAFHEVKTHKQNLGHSCVHCMAAFEKRGHLKKHLLSHFSDFNCDGCLKKLVRKGRLEQPIKRSACPHKELLRKWTCESCALNFDTEEELQQHLRIYGGPEQECSFCGVIIPHLAELDKHLEQHVMSDDVVHVCKICQRGFSKSKYLARHTANRKCKRTRTLGTGGYSRLTVGSGATHVKPEQPSFHRTKPYKCVICQRRFATKYALRRHGLVDWICGLKNVRSKSHECHSCQRRFREVRALRLHMKEHKRKPKGRKVTTLPENPETHRDKNYSLIKQKLQKSDNIWYGCKFCYKAFHGKLALNSHIRGHENRPYCCELCGAHFVLPSELSEHFASLHNEKTYRCKNCLKQFPTMSTLRQHRMRPRCHGIETRAARVVKRQSAPNFMRTGYYCISCKSSYRRLDEEREHQKLHLKDPREMPYTCNYCNAFFIKAPQSQKHLKHHLRQAKLNRDEKCRELFPTINPMYAHNKFRAKKLSHACKRCGAIFASPWDLKDHVARFHREMPYECSRCLLQFLRRASLSRHNAQRQQCSSQPFLRKQYSCISCKVGFDDVDSFREHHWLHCKKPKKLPHACCSCDAHFIDPRQYESHLIEHLRSGKATVAVESEPEPAAYGDALNYNVDYEVMAFKDDPDFQSSFSSNILPFADFNDNYAADGMDWMGHEESAKDDETDFVEETCEKEINLSTVKIERTASFESLPNPESFVIKEEQLEEEVKMCDPKAVTIKTEKLD